MIAAGLTLLNFLFGFIFVPESLPVKKKTNQIFESDSRCFPFFIGPI